MKFISVLSSLALFVASASAQAVTFIAPPFDTQVSAGVPFNVTVQLHPQATDFNVVALYFGEQLGGDPSNQELGQELAIIGAPVFQPIGPFNGLILNVPLTISSPGSTNVTLGGFFVAGVAKNPGFFVTKTRVQVV
ncbi:hypothetical protein M422DRAFT_69020 [Sphaerobolus stellatus SS14]|uniref:Unplaced genomic scaffold SPHSTscaffold_83, whole genome shotgun sequence n=1 Tax=Sphaerobolus stellatus (strain SS14) TaxID=990650 RepID=A0A0C9VLQ9_SPHS4|nr:hypothetical protein M422DRAFT_69020 [Sphaerobolus stellatus SS14]